MIQIQLPDGRRVSIQTDDAQAAASVGRKIWERDQAQMPSSGVTVAPKGGVAREAAPEEIGLEDATPPETGAWSAFGRSAVDQFANNILALPSALGDALTVNPIADAAALMRGEVPKKVSGNVPRLSVQNVAGGINAAINAPSMEDFPEQFGKEMDAQSEAKEARREANPVATTLGEVAGDVATLATGRAGIGLGRSAKTAASAAPGLEGAVVRGLNRIKKGTGKALGVGIEGAALATLNEGDPAKSAAAAAGGQALGSLAITVGKIPTSKIGFLATVGGLAALIQTYKSLTPGGRDRILESTETAFHKVGSGMLVGGAAALMGAGRLRGEQISGRLPMVMDRIADAVNTGIRGPWVSYWSGFKKAGGEAIDGLEAALGEVIANPENLTKAQERKLGNAIKSGDFNRVIRAAGSIAPTQ